MARQLIPLLGINGVDYVFIAKQALVSGGWADFMRSAESAINYLNKKLRDAKISD